MILNHSNPVIANVHVATYVAATSAVTVWGLHLGDIAVMVSTLAAVCSAAIQVMSYLDRRTPRRRGVETKPNDEAN